MTALRALITRNLSTSDNGFTMIEVLAAAAIGIVLAVTVTGVVAGTMTIVATTTATATEGVAAQRVLTDFTTTARDESTILTATTTQLTYTYRGLNQCELHSYQFGADPSNPGQLVLHHTVIGVNVSTGVKCPAVNTLLLSGTVAPKIDRDEINNLNSTSTFAYYGATGRPVPVTGNSTYVATEQAIPCTLGSVRLQLDTLAATQGTPTTANEVGYAAFRNNTRGLGCN